MTRATDGTPAKRPPLPVAVAEATQPIVALMAKADAGDQAALAELRATLTDAPELVKTASTLAQSAEHALLDALGLAKQPGTRVIVQRQLAMMRRDLRDDEATLLERLLAERLVMDWLFVQYHDLKYATACQAGMSFKEGEYWQRARERTQRQMLRSAQALATVRRLLGPAVQVNLIDKQLNVTR